MRGFLVKAGGDVIHVLQYADDTLVFLEANLNMCENLIAISLWFKRTRGLDINTKNTKAYQLNEEDNWHDYLHVWGCYEVALPNSYLGLPLGFGFKQKLV